MAQARKEPCKKEACDIQACLSKNNFLPQKYAPLINSLSACIMFSPYNIVQFKLWFDSRTSKPLGFFLFYGCATEYPKSHLSIPFCCDGFIKFPQSFPNKSVN